MWYLIVDLYWIPLMIEVACIFMGLFDTCILSLKCLLNYLPYSRWQRFKVKWYSFRFYIYFYDEGYILCHIDWSCFYTLPIKLFRTICNLFPIQLPLHFLCWWQKLSWFLQSSPTLKVNKVDLAILVPLHFYFNFIVNFFKKFSGWCWGCI